MSPRVGGLAEDVAQKSRVGRQERKMKAKVVGIKPDNT